MTHLTIKDICSKGHDEIGNEIRQIVELQLDSLKRTLAENGLTLDVTDEALRFIAHEGYDPQFGARPVKRVIQRYVLNELSKQIIAGNVDNRRPIKVLIKNNTLVFEN